MIRNAMLTRHHAHGVLKGPLQAAARHYSPGAQRQRGHLELAL